MKDLKVVPVACAAVVGLALATAVQAGPNGWLQWRGPQQSGVSTDKALPVDLSEKSIAWVKDYGGRGSVVIGDYLKTGRAYVWGYEGEGVEQHEVLRSVDPKTGDVQWAKPYYDFLSDVIYERYSIGAPTIDAQTGNVYLLTTPGLLVCHSPKGDRLWQVSMMEEFGRLTFPNGRTGAVGIDGDLVIVNAITSNWGRQGPARNRFYAFEKTTGRAVWASDPGVGPPFLKDSSFCTPVFADEGDLRVFYACLGDGNVVCVNASNGKPIWRYQMAVGGVNSSVVLTKDAVIAVHGKENPDDTGRGRMVAIKRHATPEPDAEGRPTLGKDDELWRNNEVAMFTSSPVLVGERVYQLSWTGEFFCIDANTGKTIWKKKLANSTLHASAMYANGVLYVPLWNDGVFVIKDDGEEARILGHYQLDGSCIGSPTAYAGRLYIQTTNKLYCFKKPNLNLGDAAQRVGAEVAEGGEQVGRLVGEGLEAATSFHNKIQVPTLRVIPNEFLLKPGGRVGMFTTLVDSETGRVAAFETMDIASAEPWIPPTAKVRAQLDAHYDAGEIVASESAKYSAGAFRFVKGGGVEGFARGRILPEPPFSEDFDSFKLTAKNQAGQAFAYPPLPWIGARLKWEVRADPTDPQNKVLTKTLDRVLFQRSMIFLGHADAKDYMVQADVMSDGNRRGMSTVGVINQRYIICLDGNAQTLRVYSNIENFNRARDLGTLTSRVDLKWKPRIWYTIKSKIAVNEDGSGEVRAKAWPRDEAEPEQWTIKVALPQVHTQGSPGIFGFSPQSRFPVYVDNLKVAQ